MKKIILSITIVCLALALYANNITNFGVNAAGDVSNKGKIYINDVEISNEDTVLMSDDEMFIPLRTIFEALKSDVIWEENTGNIYFDFNDDNYVCKLREVKREDFPPLYLIQICKAENKDSINNSDYIQLNPMSADGAYRMINDRTYLHQQTGQRLFEALGFKVEVDLERNTLEITDI